MLLEPICYIRKCKHYQGVKWFGDEESTEDNYCHAFPDGIPLEIAHGGNHHSEPCCGQDNDIVYEKE